MQSDYSLVVPCIVHLDKKGIGSVEVPDLKLTVYGNSLLEAIASAMETVTAIYYYKTDKNVTITVKETYDTLLAKMPKSRDRYFIHVLTIKRD